MKQNPACRDTIIFPRLLEGTRVVSITSQTTRGPFEKNRQVDHRDRNRYRYRIRLINSVLKSRLGSRFRFRFGEEKVFRTALEEVVTTNVAFLILGAQAACLRRQRLCQTYCRYIWRRSASTHRPLDQKRRTVVSTRPKRAPDTDFCDCQYLPPFPSSAFLRRAYTSPVNEWQ